jgi:hypothetical protein
MTGCKSTPSLPDSGGAHSILTFNVSPLSEYILEPTSIDNRRRIGFRMTHEMLPTVDLRTRKPSAFVSFAENAAKSISLLLPDVDDDLRSSPNLAGVSL